MRESKSGVKTQVADHSPSRRDVLKATALGLGVPLLGALSSGCSDGNLQEEAQQVGQPQRLANLPTQFSREEGNRRWERVREMMNQEGFDCLLTPAGRGDAQADSRYLTQIGTASWVIFPAEGPVIAVVDNGGVERWKERQDWVTDLRPAEDGQWSPPLIEVLRELKMERARIGVSRLVGVLRDHEGTVTFTTLDQVRQAFPNARFESATDQMMRIKLLRSQEEIDVMEKAAAAGELAIQAMIQTARPGLQHQEVWIEMFRAVVEATGEQPSRLAVRAGYEANTSTGGPMFEVLKAGQVMNQEIGASVLGYMAQVNHSICIGQPPPEDWETAAQYCRDVFYELVDWIQPGKLLMDLCRLYVEKASARGDEPYLGVLVHTCGFGDGPRMGATRTETVDLVIEPTMVFTLKPRIVIKGAQPTAQFGDPVLVTESGARRLGKRELEVLTVGV